MAENRQIVWASKLRTSRLCRSVERVTCIESISERIGKTKS